MKVLTVLFALLVVILSVMPCCITDDNCTSAEAETAQTDSHEKDADVCSPFYSCSACIGFTVSDVSVAPAPPLLLPDRNYDAAYRQSFFSSFQHAIWQPPKLG